MANTVNVSCYAAAYEGTRDAIAAAQRKKARKSEDKSEAEETVFVTLQSSSIDIGIAMQAFLCSPSFETLKIFVKLMGAHNGQHSWYKNYKKKLTEGQPAGQWLFEMLSKKPKPHRTLIECWRHLIQIL